MLNEISKQNINQNDHINSISDLNNFYKLKITKESNKHPFIFFLRTKADDSIQTLIETSTIKNNKGIFTILDINHLDNIFNSNNNNHESKEWKSSSYKIYMFENKIRLIYSKTKKEIENLIEKSKNILNNNILMKIINEKYQNIINTHNEKLINKIRYSKRLVLYIQDKKEKIERIIYKSKEKFYNKNEESIISKDIFSKIYEEEDEILKTKKKLASRIRKNIIRSLFSIEPNWVLYDKNINESMTTTNINQMKNFESIFYKIYIISKDAFFKISKKNKKYTKIIGIPSTIFLLSYLYISTKVKKIKEFKSKPISLNEEILFNKENEFFFFNLLEKQLLTIIYKHKDRLNIKYDLNNIITEVQALIKNNDNFNYEFTDKDNRIYSLTINSLISQYKILYNIRYFLFLLPIATITLALYKDLYKRIGFNKSLLCFGAILFFTIDVFSNYNDIVEYYIRKRLSYMFFNSNQSMLATYEYYSNFIIIDDKYQKRI